MGFCLKSIAKILSRVLAMLGASMFLPVITALAYGEDDCVRSFLVVALPCIFFGVILQRIIPYSRHNMRLRDGFLLVTLTWLLLASIAAVPVVISGSMASWFDAFFEMCSGFSTTGATVCEDVEALPHAILLWRSFSHWIGGMGILVFAIAWMPALGISGQEIAEAETPGPVLSKITPKMSETARDLYLIYIAFTLIETVLLMIGGMGLFDAVTHSFATVGTGGFGNYNDSIAHFGSTYIDIVITVFMLLSGINFNLYFFVLRRKVSIAVKDDEFKAYILIFTVATLIITFYGTFSNTFDGFFEGLHQAAFQVASILTTTGFSTCDFALWPPLCMMVLFVLFFIGGCSSSTGGGIKVVRVLIIIRMIGRSAALKLHPNAYITIKYNNRKFSTDTVQGICAFVCLYLFTLFAVTLWVALDNYDMVTSFTATASCLGNIGPGFSSVGPAENFGIFSNSVKLVLSLTMITGRLELFTILMMFSRRFWLPDE